MEDNLALAIFLALPVVTGGLLFLFARRMRGRAVANRWLNLALGNFLVLLFLISLCLPIGEIYYRYIYDTTDSLDYSKTSELWFQRHYHQNSWSCRDNINYVRTRAPGKRRISFVGDSFTAGHGVNDVESVFALRLRKEHPEWEIHILARPGFDTGHEQRVMEDCFTNNYQVDQVVLVYCLNDISDLLPESYEAVQRIYDESDHSGWLRRHSYLVNTLYNRFDLLRNPDLKRYFGLILDAYRGPAWQQQQARLKAFRDLVEAHGGKLSVVTFPFFNLLGPNYEYQFVHDELGQCWRDLGVPHLDLLPIYKGIPPKKLMVNHFDAHPNEYAHALAAQAIEKFMKERIASTPDNTNNLPVAKSHAPQ